MMSEITGKFRNKYVYYPKGESKTCLIHGPRHSSDECKGLEDFGYKYVKRIPTKELRHDHVPRNKLNRQKYNNAIVNRE